MVIKERVKPVPGDLKIETRFAWLPVWVNDKKVWMVYYQRLYEFKIRNRSHYNPLLGRVISGIWGQYDLISEKIVKK